MPLFDGRCLQKRKLRLAQRLAEGQLLHAMSGVELLHQPGRAFVIYVPQACYYSRDAGHQESLRQTAQSLIASLVAKTRAAARENDQARSFRLPGAGVVQ